MATIKVSSARFYAFHGCHPEESKVGGRFEVDITVQAPSATNDDVNGTIDYVDLLRIAKEGMTKRQNLIETVARNIVNDIRIRFPQATGVEVCLRKVDAPVSAPHAFVSVIERWPA